MPSDTETTTPKPKKQRAEKAATKVPKEKKSDPGAPKPKRGPARPHRRLALDVIESRITKLQKRLDRAKSQIEDAGRHVEGYLRERDFRAKEGGLPSTTNTTDQ
jgi:hypothetical protein